MYQFLLRDQFGQAFFGENTGSFGPAAVPTCILIMFKNTSFSVFTDAPLQPGECKKCTKNTCLACLAFFGRPVRSCFSGRPLLILTRTAIFTSNSIWNFQNISILFITGLHYEVFYSIANFWVIRNDIAQDFQIFHKISRDFKAPVEILIIFY